MRSDSATTAAAPPPTSNTTAQGSKVAWQGRSWQELLLPWVAAFCFSFALWHGTPVLFHDWPAPYRSFSTNLGAISGWDVTGIGSPVAYPSNFLIVPLLGLVTSTFGPHAAILAFMFVIVYVAAFGAQACARAVSPSFVSQLVAVLVCLFNPWTFTQLVSGHTFMLMSYAGTVLLASALLRNEKKDGVFILSALFIVAQIQFFVISVPFAIAFGAVTRRVSIAVTWCALALPIAVGVLLNKSSLLAIPLTTAWEASQSLQFSNAFRLTGYFANYATAFDGGVTIAEWLIVGLAAAGAIVALRTNRRLLVVAVATLTAILVAWGTNAPWQYIVDALFENVPATGLFRELYDLVGFAAIGYVIFVALASRIRVFAVLAMVASVVLFVTWMSALPFKHWVYASDVPRIAITGTNERFALVPAFQPMTFRGKGSGIDPDSYPRHQNLTPLNESFASYPVDAALAEYIRNGDSRPLARLSVGTVVTRSYLSTNFKLMGPQFALPAFRPRGEPQGTVRLQANPELGISALPDVGTLNNEVGAGNIFFADASHARGTLIPASWTNSGFVVPIEVPRTGVDAANGWVDARLAFTVLPQIAQQFGGVLTTDPRASFPLNAKLQALVYIQGALEDQKGDAVSKTTHGYRWIRVPRGTSAVHCHGLCVLALQGMSINAPLRPPVKTESALTFTLYTPWLLVSRLPSGAVRTLRYNVAYNDLWEAWSPGIELDHLRLDGVMNGWIAPRTSSTKPVVIVELGAAGVAASEIAAVILILCVILVPVIQERKREKAIS